MAEKMTKETQKEAKPNGTEDATKPQADPRGEMWEYLNDIWERRIIQHNNRQGVVLYFHNHDFDSKTATYYWIRWDDSEENEMHHKDVVRPWLTTQWIDHPMVPIELRMAQKCHFDHKATLEAVKKAVNEEAAKAKAKREAQPKAKATSATGKGKKGEAGQKLKVKAGGVQKARARAAPKPKTAPKPRAAPGSKAGSKGKAAPKQQAGAQGSKDAKAEPWLIEAPKGGKTILSWTGRRYPEAICLAPGDKLLVDMTDEDRDPTKDFIMERIVDQACIGGVQHYLVKWQGYQLDMGDGTLRNRGDWYDITAVQGTAPFQHWVRAKKPDYFAAVSPHKVAAQCRAKAGRKT